MESFWDPSRFGPPFCCGLIDQKRYIGQDPVGHSCSRRATKYYRLEGFFWHVCEECYRDLTEDGGWVTLPAWRAMVGEG